jgi:hypothetical protein
MPDMTPITTEITRLISTGTVESATAVNTFSVQDNRWRVKTRKEIGSDGADGASGCEE